MPYDREPDQDPGADQGAAPDPYLRDAFRRDPHLRQQSPGHAPQAHPGSGGPHGSYDPHAPQPGAAPYDPTPGAAPYADPGNVPPPPPPAPGEPEAYQQPQMPDPQLWATPPAPEPHGGPHGDDGRGGHAPRAQYTGVDDLLAHAQGTDRERTGQQPSDDVPRALPNDDAFAHLFRDQNAAPPAAQHTPTAAPRSPYPPPADRHPQQPGGQEPPVHQPPVQTPAAAAGHPPFPPQQSAAPQPGAESPPPPPPGETPAPESAAPEPEPAAARKSGGGGGLLKSSAIMAAGTLVSRLTGFLRTVVITAALGAAMLGDTYTIAYMLPTMIYMLSIGGGLNSVFVPQLVRAMKNDDDGGVAYANRLLTLVMVALAALVGIAVLIAPLLIKMLSVPIAGNEDASNVAITFARYCLPTIFFMGVHVVMGQILNARGRFGAMMWTPVLNNIVIIATFGAFIWVYGTQRSSELGVTTISEEGVRLLGIGTLLGLVVQALAMVPYLRAAGFNFRPRFDWRGHGLGKAAKLAKWTILFVLANQAGLVVISQLATSAGADAAEAGNAGAGIMGYNNALLIWQMPQAIITVSVMAALLPRLSRSAHDGDLGAVRDDLSHGLRTSAVAIVPISFGFIALGVPMCMVLFSSAGTTAAASMGFILMAFGVGLIPFSVQYVVLRAFYAFEDTRTPFYNTVIVAAGNAAGAGLCYLVLPSRWAVAGMAGFYGVAYAVGVLIAWRRLSRKENATPDAGPIIRTYTRLALASVPAAALSGATAYFVLGAVGSGFLGGAASLLAGSVVLAVVFVLAAKRLRVQEMTAMVGMVRAKLGR
ncbi:murein biosynthesis integral membrane protein MurJ [Streptomyces sp. XM4193]|nr:murein biosynthesis integral membrane protein MurJ [Streptomyces sp. XM4193]MCK1794627.1 murein biosynthesis integral membrane protein MurJ [Streptomyces sp. XM4193]